MSDRPRRAPRVVIVNINLDPRMLDGCHDIQRVTRELVPGLDAPIHPWPEAPDVVRRLRPDAVILGPNETPFPAYPAAFDAFLGWVRRRRGPTLGICGGHQALALAHGAPVAPVHRVPAATTSYAGMPKVKADVRVRLLGDPDPFTADLPDEITLVASHVDEVKTLPRGFRLLALGDPCHIQIIRADNRPLYGLQCHPERDCAVPDPAGRRLLANFLSRVAGLPLN